MANNARLLVRFADALAMQTAVAFRSPIVVPAGIHRTCGGLARPSLPEKSARSDDLQSGIGPWLPSPAEDGRISPWVSVRSDTPVDRTSSVQHHRETVQLHRSRSYSSSSRSQAARVACSEGRGSRTLASGIAAGSRPVRPGYRHVRSRD